MGDDDPTSPPGRTAPMRPDERAAVEARLDAIDDPARHVSLAAVKDAFNIE